MFLLTFALLAAKLRLRDLSFGSRRQSTVFVLVLLQALIISNCNQTEYRYVNRTVEVKPKHSPKRLTVDLIDEFKLSSDDLMMLKYSIENALLLRDISHKGHAQVTSDRALDLKRTTKENELVFPHMVVGHPVGIERVWQLVRFRPSRVYRIAVKFENFEINKRPVCLTFSPNWWGEYVIERNRWNKKVSYEGKEFTNTRGDIECYLLVYLHLIDEIEHSRRIVPGMEPNPN